MGHKPEPRKIAPWLSGSCGKSRFLLNLAAAFAPLRMCLRGSLGVARVIVGTMAVARPEDLIAALREFGPEKLVLAVDARNGRVAIEGWQKDANVDVLDLALKFKSSGLRRVLYTDIQRDGMFSGPNFEATKEVALRSGLKVIASGGVSSKEDLQRLAELEPFGVDSVVVGRAFYENKISAQEVLGAG